MIDWTELIRREERWLRRLARDMTGDAQAADDLIQDLYLTLLPRPPAGSAIRRAWLAAVLRNLHLMSVRGAIRRVRRESTAKPETCAPETDEALHAARVARRVRTEIDRLPRGFRETVELRYFEDLPFDEIGTRLGVPAATARKRHQLALDRLRSALMEDRSRGVAAFLPWTILPKLRRAASHVRARPIRYAFLAAAGAALVVGAGRPRLFVGSDRDSHATNTAEAHAQRSFLPRFQAAREAAVTAVSPAVRPQAQPAVTETDACPLLQSLIDAAAPGAIIEAPACLFREQLSVAKPLTLVGRPGAEIRGSDIWTEFTAVGDVFVSAHMIPVFTGKRNDCDRPLDDPCAPLEQVYRDDQPLALRADSEPLGKDEFALTADRRVVLSEDPRGHVIEVVVRPVWIEVRARAVTVRGFRMSQAASGDGGALHVGGGGRARIEGNVLSRASGAALGVEGSGNAIEGNDIFGAGEGVVLFPGDHLVRGNRIHDNGRVYRRGGPRWSVGGLSAVHARVRLEDNHIYDNRGVGVHLSGGTGEIQRNNIFDNWGNGVSQTRTERVVVRENKFWSNGWRARPREAGIFLASAREISIEQNLLYRHPIGIRVEPLRSPTLEAGFDTCRASTWNLVRANTIVETQGPAVALSGDPRGRPDLPACATNRVLGTRVWGSRVAPELAGDVRLMPDGEKDWLLTVAGVPIAPPFPGVHIRPSGGI